jgi:hypothetical protein
MYFNLGFTEFSKSEKNVSQRLSYVAKEPKMF